MLWPQKSDCAHEYPSVPPPHLLPTYYLSPETQGLRLVHIPGQRVYLNEKSRSLSLEGYVIYQNIPHSNYFSEICLVYVQPSGNSSLWEQQSSSDGRTPKLWSCPPTISNPPACLTRLASGGKGAARFFCLPGICLACFFLYRCVSDLNRNIMDMYRYHEEYIIKYLCPLCVFLCL